MSEYAWVVTEPESFCECWRDAICVHQLTWLDESYPCRHVLADTVVLPTARQAIRYAILDIGLKEPEERMQLIGHRAVVNGDNLYEVYAVVAPHQPRLRDDPSECSVPEMNAEVLFVVQRCNVLTADDI